MITCQQLIEALLADYLDGTLRPDQMAELEEHLAACPPCVAYLNTYRKTRELVQQQAAEMPPELQAALRKFVLSRIPRPTP
jgi:anti-sigma factor (TIGR02949 family)